MNSRSTRLSDKPFFREAVIGFAALAGLAVVFGLLWLTSVSYEAVVRDSREVLRLTRQARYLAGERQSALREYSLSRTDYSLALQQRAQAELAPKLDTLGSLAPTDAAQQLLISNLRKAITQWDEGYASLVARDTSAVAQLAAADRSLFAEVRNAANALLDFEEERYRGSARRADRFKLATLLLVLALAVAVASAIRRLYSSASSQALELLEQQAYLEEQAAELEQQVEESTALAEQLAVANRALEEENEIRRKAENAHAHSESLLRFVLDGAPVGVALQDEGGTLRLVNRAFAELSGAAGDELIGRRLADADPLFAERLEPIFEQVRQSDRAVVNVDVQPPGDSGARDHSWVASVYPVRTESAARLGMGVIIVDTTELRSLEHQLLQSQKMEAVGRLAGGIAHDFNNLLTVILSYATMAAEELDPDDPVRQDLTEIEDAARRAASLTSQLLAFSRKQVLQPRLLDLNDVVDSLDRMLRRLIGEDIELVTILEPGIGPVLADQSQVEQVLMNLAVNARDAMPEGGRLIIETAEREVHAEHTGRLIGVAPGRFAVLSVSDTGVGMSAEAQRNAFEPFFTTKPAGQGTGLGLATVYGIVKQSGGDIWLYSELGHGTTFRIYLPIAADSDALDASPEPPARSGGHETILLAEDDAALRPLTTRVLSNAGYRVLTAANGLEALSVARSHEGAIDLVVSDVVMPQLSGRMVMEELRKERPELRFLFMSGYTDDDLMRRGVVMANTAFLQKPFTPAELLAKIRSVLDPTPHSLRIADPGDTPASS